MNYQLKELKELASRPRAASIIDDLLINMTDDDPDFESIESLLTFLERLCSSRLRRLCIDVLPRRRVVAAGRRLWRLVSRFPKLSYLHLSRLRTQAPTLFAPESLADLARLPRDLEVYLRPETMPEIEPNNFAVVRDAIAASPLSEIEFRGVDMAALSPQQVKFWKSVEKVVILSYW